MTDSINGAAAMWDRMKFRRSGSFFFCAAGGLGFAVPGTVGARPQYRLTAAGFDLCVVLGALQQWGDTYLPLAGGPVTARCERNTGKSVSVSFIDDTGSPIDPHHVRLDGPPSHNTGPVSPSTTN